MNGSGPAITRKSHSSFSGLRDLTNTDASSAARPSGFMFKRIIIFDKGETL